MGGCGGGEDVRPCLWNPSADDIFGVALCTLIGGACNLNGEVVVFDCGDTDANCIGEPVRPSALRGEWTD